MVKDPRTCHVILYTHVITYIICGLVLIRSLSLSFNQIAENTGIRHLTSTMDRSYFVVHNER